MEFESVPVTEIGAKTSVLDVREADEFAAGHIPGALHIPLGELPLRLNELDPDVDYSVICLRGGRSARATEWLVSQGYSAINVSGGMEDWARCEREIVSETGTPYVKGH